MSDIFSIKGVDAYLKVGEKMYKFADPNILSKVLLKKEMTALQKEKENMPEDEFIMAAYGITKKMIKQHLPDMEDAFLDNLGDFAMGALLEKLQELSDKKFNASVSKVEGKFEAAP